ncbi:MAG: hypothetical protein OXU36_03740 [Candidatus Poribacteria bacterium]|nr:hypothetical protein [Candidatus Poribacteria bacterium]
MFRKIVKPFVTFVLMLLSCGVSQVDAQVVEIPDATLRVGIQRHLEIDTVLTVQHMLRLTDVYLEDQQKIRDLTGLEHAKNLQELNLNAISSFGIG